MNIDLTAVLEKARKEADRREDKYHFHPAGEEGASGQGDCPFLRACYDAGIPMPKKEGAKGDTGAMFVGRVFHDTFEELLVKALQKEYPDLCVGNEIYGQCEITPGHVAYSPIDIGIATPPGFITVKHKFKDGELEVREKHPDAKWVWIGDLKSAAAFGYEKQKDGGLDRSKIYQGLIYMKMCGVDSIPFHFIHKDNAMSFSHVLQWDQAQWDELVLTRRRVAFLARQLTAKKPIHHVESDFGFCGEDTKWKCNYCPLSKTHEEIPTRKDGQPIKGRKPQIKLDEPCEAAKLFTEAQALGVPADLSDDEAITQINTALNAPRECIRTNCHAPIAAGSNYFCEKHQITDKDVEGL